MTTNKTIATFLALLSMSAGSLAADVGQHPAVFSPRSLPSIDVATFRVGHPAQGAPGVAVHEHANFQHPAIVIHRSAAQPHIDVHAYLVQPPATTRWIH
jgi:hypothetical protein